MRNKVTKAIFLEEYIEINSIKQYLFHSGNNINNPVMLFLHGGPGSAESIFSHLFQEEWEDLFTVVHWDQRGAGKTLTKNKTSLPTIELLLKDLYEITCYLRKKYNQDKIIILGHSWGSVLGTLFIQKHPELVSYYIGVGQVIDIIENEKIGYDKLKELIIEADNKKDLKKLQSIGQYPGKNFSFNDMKSISLVRNLQGKYKLAITPNLSLILSVFKSPILKFSDISAFLKGNSANREVFNSLCTINLNNNYNYEVPVYYILGKNDWQTPYPIASTYLEKITAPEKKLYLVENAGHMTMMDNRRDFFRALTDVKNSFSYLK